MAEQRKSILCKINHVLEMGDLVAFIYLVFHKAFVMELILEKILMKLKNMFFNALIFCNLIRKQLEK